LTTSYQPFFWVELEIPENFKGTEFIQVPATNFDRRREGGPGLDDLQGLLTLPDPSAAGKAGEWQSVTDQMLDEDQSDEEARLKVIDVKIESSGPSMSYLIAHTELSTFVPNFQSH
jgi:hypothetical protein